MGKQKCTAVELFAGCGGISTGLLDIGIAVRLGTDYYAPAMRTFEYNHAYRGARALVADVRKLSAEDVLEASGLRRGQLKLLAGGPPCQPFSIIGKRGALTDPRGDLVFQFVRLLEELAPEAFLFENVAHLSTVAEGAVLSALLEAMHSAGYATAASVLAAADYGVPQMRKRLIIVGARGRVSPSFPPFPTHGDMALFGQRGHVTTREALDDLPDVWDPRATSIPNHEPTNHGAEMLEAFRSLAPGKRDPKSHHDRLHPDRPAYTLRAGTGNFSPLRPVHYKYDRVISVRESARLQSFSDEFIWPNDIPRLQQYRQVGNAVPPRLAAAVGEHLAAWMGWKLDAEHTRGDARLREEWLPVEAAARDLDRRRRTRGASLGKLAAG